MVTMNSAFVSYQKYNIIINIIKYLPYFHKNLSAL